MHTACRTNKKMNQRRRGDAFHLVVGELFSMQINVPCDNANQRFFASIGKPPEVFVPIMNECGLGCRHSSSVPDLHPITLCIKSICSMQGLLQELQNNAAEMHEIGFHSHAPPSQPSAIVTRHTSHSMPHTLLIAWRTSYPMGCTPCFT